MEAVTIVWVAARFTEEHRSTLDWLNRITDESFKFFGLEIELWRIGQSSAAPKFNIVSMPNDWTQSVAQAARAIDESELSETRVMQRAYWDAFQQALQSIPGPLSGKRKAQPQSWMAYPIGRVGFHLGVVMHRPKRYVRVELYLKGDRAKAMLAQLQTDRAAIESELGYAVDWEELPARRDCRVSLVLSDTDPSNEQEWPQQHQWLAKHINDFHRVFAPRVADLELDELAASE